METETIDARPTGLARFAAHAVTTIDELREINGFPRPETRDKETDHLTPLLVDYIAASPFFLLATAGADGTCDVTPRGDAAGAVRVLDERTIALPDRLGNRRMDSLQNLVTNPHVGLLFLIPAVDETVRVNGRAVITRDPELLATLAMRGKAPNLVIVVEIDQVYTHCARAFLRSGLWQPETWPDPDAIPSMAAIRAEQKCLPAPDESAGKRNEDYRKTLY
ncbi:MAG TPA: pyridoxamine 5'-phosphate oxidase family protein [Thermomicrobiales bacterium]|nr:pyridoxamine 5'-phosphate oxidase family protein [Thermomicrobiales bacterium]